MSKKVRKFIVINIIIMLLNFIKIPAFSAEGCPQTWDKSKIYSGMPLASYQDFFTPNFETIISRQTKLEHSFDGNIWNSLDWGEFSSGMMFANSGIADVDFKKSQVNALKSYFGNHFDGNGKGYIGNLEYLKYKEIQMRMLINVEKKGCGAPTIFELKFTVKTPDLYFSNLETELTKIEKSFTNFKDKDLIASNYEACKQKWKKLNYSKDNLLPVEQECFLTKGVRSDTPIIALLKPLKSNCLDYYPGNSNRADGAKLHPGSACEYLVLVSDWSNLNLFVNSEIKPMSYEKLDEYIVIDKLVIKSIQRISSKSLIKSTITCTKGDMIKKVSGYNPTCPSGYKKK